MSDRYRILVGLRKPETAKECEDQATIQGKRAAIYRAARESSLISQVLQVAELQGLSGEDRYTLLAYHALQALEDKWSNHLDRAMRDPMPPVVWKDEPL
jgi:hypothetical protein